MTDITTQQHSKKDALSFFVFATFPEKRQKETAIILQLKIILYFIQTQRGPAHSTCQTQIYAMVLSSSYMPAPFPSNGQSKCYLYCKALVTNYLSNLEGQVSIQQKKRVRLQQRVKSSLKGPGLYLP